jgi:hypothetical protein
MATVDCLPGQMWFRARGDRAFGRRDRHRRWPSPRTNRRWPLSNNSWIAASLQNFKEKTMTDAPLPPGERPVLALRPVLVHQRVDPEPPA